MTKWILVLVAALAISVPSLAQYKDKDKDNDKQQMSSESQEKSEQHRESEEHKGMTKGKMGGEQQIKALNDQYREAVLKGDTAFIEKHLADNYVGIGGNGQPMDKQETVQARKEGKIKYDSIDIKDSKVRTFGNTAIVQSEAHVKGTTPSGPVDGNFRATHVWVKQGNDWKLVSFQATPEQGTQAATNK